MARSSGSTDGGGLCWGLDVGGSSALLGYLDPSDATGFELVENLPTGPDLRPETLLREVAGIVSSVGRGDAPASLGIGVAGLVDHHGGILLRSPNLPAWESFQVRSFVEDLLDVPVSVDNDCNVFAVAAVDRGEVPGDGLWLVVTVGTGIGGTILLDGEVVRGRGQAGEVGHMTLNPDGPECPCGSRGCWERYAGRSALLRYYRDSGGGSTGMDPRDLARMARSGDRAAGRAFELLGTWLGIGLANLDNCFCPDGIALGGGLAGAFDLFEESASREFRSRAMNPSWNVRPLEKALTTGAHGAALLGRRAAGGGRRTTGRS